MAVLRPNLKRKRELGGRGELNKTLPDAVCLGTVKVYDAEPKESGINFHDAKNATDSRGRSDAPDLAGDSD